MLDWLAVVGLLLHGLLHLVGFFVPWRFAGIAVLHADEVAGGRIRLSVAASRILGLLWLFVAIMFMVAAVGLIFDVSWTLGLISVASIGSIPLCLTKLPDMAIGAAIDVVILIVVLPIAITGTPLFS